MAEAPKPTDAQLESLARRSDTRHGVPALLSFFVPGLGQFIKGNIGTALTVWLGLGIFIGVGLAGLWLTFLGIPILWIWSLYDAYVAPDGPTRREMDRLTGTLVVLAACTLINVGCGNVTAIATDDGGTGGASGSGGKLGLEAGAGGQAGSASSTGGTGAASGGAPGTGGVTNCNAGENPCSDGLCAGPGNTQDCGICGRVCPVGSLCSGGSCNCSESNQKLCGGACVDITSASNCGNCGIKCGSGQTCVGGACNGGGGVGGSCGSSGSTCSGGQTCQSGQCKCAAGDLYCNGSCIASDATHCGTCSTVCASGQTCLSNICV